MAELLCDLVAEDLLGALVDGTRAERLYRARTIRNTVRAPTRARVLILG